MTFGSLIKGVPGFGWTVGALTMPVFSAGVTWVIGRVFMKHFASGGTLLDFDPPDYKEFIKAQQEKVASKFGRGSKSGSTAEDGGLTRAGAGCGRPDLGESTACWIVSGVVRPGHHVQGDVRLWFYRSRCSSHT